MKNHVRNILEKLQLRCRMEAAVYAVREQLLDADLTPSRRRVASEQPGESVPVGTAIAMSRPSQKILHAGEGKRAQGRPVDRPRDQRASSPRSSAARRRAARRSQAQVDRPASRTGPERRGTDRRLLDDMLPEAFADRPRGGPTRVLGQRHFDVQLMGGAALHFGWVAEMKTGEGKTLVATLPSYLNALAGRACTSITVNDYLARVPRRLDGSAPPLPGPRGRRRRPRR